MPYFELPHLLILGIFVVFFIGLFLFARITLYFSDENAVNNNHYFLFYRSSSLMFPRTLRNGRSTFPILLFFFIFYFSFAQPAPSQEYCQDNSESLVGWAAEFENGWRIEDKVWSSNYWSDLQVNGSHAVTGTRHFYVPKNILNSDDFWYATMLDPQPSETWENISTEGNTYGAWSLTNGSWLVYDMATLSSNVSATPFAEYGCRYTSYNTPSPTNRKCHGGSLSSALTDMYYTDYLHYCSPVSKYTGLGIRLTPINGTANKTLRNTVSRTCTNSTITYRINQTMGYNTSAPTQIYYKYWTYHIPQNLEMVENFPIKNNDDQRKVWAFIDPVGDHCNVSRRISLGTGYNNIPYLVDVGGNIPYDFNTTAPAIKRKNRIKRRTLYRRYYDSL